MQLTSNEIVGRALEALVRGLQQYVQRELHGQSGSTPKTGGQTAKETQSMMDPLNLLNRILDNWPVFRPVFGKEGRAYIHELIEFRHKWAHAKPLSLEDGIRVCDTVERLLTMIAAEETIAAVRALRSSAAGVPDRPHQREPNAGDQRPNSIDRIAVITCTKLKLKHPAPAVEMYSPSLLFRRSCEEAQKERLQLFIVSTKYGLIAAEEVIEPYEQTFPSMTVAQRREWEDLVARQVDALCAHARPREVLFFAGRDYRNPIQRHFARHQVTTSIHPRWQAICEDAFGHPKPRPTPKGSVS